MGRHLAVFGLVLTLLPLAVAQEPPPAQPSAEAEVQRVIEEVNAFYREYWRAWDERDVKKISESLDEGFVSYLHVSGRVMQANKEASVEGVRQFMDSVRGKQTLWNRSLLTVAPRSATEVTAAVRSDFSVVDTTVGEIEVTLEVLRRGADGRWRLVRKWSERLPF